MKILVVTPLYPPDIVESASYVKELASRLKETYTVTVLAYNHIPETIPHVRIVSIEKNILLPIRLIKFTYTLLKLLRDTDIVYVQNGPSVELPVFIATLLTRKRFVMRLGDTTALHHAVTNRLYKFLLRMTLYRAEHIVTHTVSSVHANQLIPLSLKQRVHNVTFSEIRPEILPFAPYPDEALTQYETSWKKHITELTHICTI